MNQKKINGKKNKIPKPETDMNTCKQRKSAPKSLRCVRTACERAFHLPTNNLEMNQTNFEQFYKHSNSVNVATIHAPLTSGNY